MTTRIPKPDPRHEKLRERIGYWIEDQQDDALADLLNACLAALEPAAPQPAADDVVRAVRELRLPYDEPHLQPVPYNEALDAAERAIRAVFAAAEETT